jgi:DNA-binding MarR family transcriptional regulator
MPSTTATRSETVTDLVRSLYGITMIQREINRHALAQLGSQGFAALAIVGLHGPLRVSDVAARLHVDLSVASRQVAALDRAGHVSRTPDGEDRRALVVEVTDGGRAVLQDTHRRMVEAFGEALADWSDADIASLTAALSRLRSDFEEDPNTR